MKLNNQISFQFVVIILIFIYHYYFHNNFEKLFTQSYFPYNDIKRPLEKCDKEINKFKLYCVGMPSGHAEAFSLLSFLLYFYKFIPFWLCLVIIISVSLQRIIKNKHTLFQIFVGLLLGFTYGNIYKYFNLSIYGFLIIFTIGLILLILSKCKCNTVEDFKNKEKQKN